MLTDSIREKDGELEEHLSPILHTSCPIWRDVNSVQMVQVVLDIPCADTFRVHSDNLVRKGYFLKNGKGIRTRLGTVIWAEQMCELRIPPRRK